MRPILPRRAASSRAAALLAAAVLLSPPAAWAQKWTPYAPPPEVAADPSHVLSTDMRAGPGTVTLYDTAYASNLYDGRLLPPILRLRPGDSLRVRLKNAMGDSAANVTNLHFHGFAVSPRPPADNVTMIHVAPGEDYQYAMRLPADHPEGLFWFHPHAHGTSYDQVRGGMSGAISIGDPRRFFPEPIRGAPEFFLLLKQFEPPAGASISTVNGVEAVRLPDMRTGDVQVWRIANISTERYYRLQIKGADGRPVPFRTLARDGNVVGQARVVMDSVILMGAGNRAEIAVRMAKPGDYTLATDSFIRQEKEGLANYIIDPAAVLATVRVHGPALVAAPLEGTGGDPREGGVLRALAALGPDDVVRDTVEFEIIRSATAPTLYLVDSLAYDPKVVNKVIEMGKTYEWTITNPTPSWHPFHIHQTDFLVLWAGGVTMPPDYRLDTVNVPPHGSATIRFTYERPTVAGPFVYHCHILFHEDNGMMANVVLVNPGADAQGAAPTPSTGHSGSHR
jgi:suppressor of ftsI